VNTSYTAANIRVAKDAEIIDAWDWAKVGHWCHVYGCHAEWLARAVEACRRAGRDPGYIERRYLQGLRDEEPFDQAVDAAMREILEEVRLRTFSLTRREEHHED
jgi:hypothetical protein